MPTNDNHPTPTANRPKRTRLPAAQRREQILDAAAAVIVERGFDGLTMEAITDRAGVSKALGYSYFNRLEDLLHALYDREFSVIYERLRPILLSEAPIETRIRDKVHTYFDVIAERHDLYIRLNTNLRGPTYRQEREERQYKWEGFVAEIVEAEYRVPKHLSRAVARLLMVLDDRCVQLWTRDGLPREEIEEVCVHFQLAGLEAILERRAKKPLKRPSTTRARRSRT
jgi:AcrR family transcriptional regulator